jgi:hypothetical protein
MALGVVGQKSWHTPQPTHPGDSTSGGPSSLKRIAAVPNGQRSTQSVHDSPALRTHTLAYTSATPMRMSRGSRTGSNAPLGHAVVHINPEHTTQAARSASMTGVPSARSPDAGEGKMA